MPSAVSVFLLVFFVFGTAVGVEAAAPVPDGSTGAAAPSRMVPPESPATKRYLVTYLSSIFPRHPAALVPSRW